MGLLARAIVPGSSLPATGATFMLVVAPQSLAGLAAQLAAGSGTQWLLYPALAGVAIGLLLYPYAATKFDLRELSSGAGELWVAVAVWLLVLGATIRAYGGSLTREHR